MTPGAQVRVAPRVGAAFAWITFEANGRTVPRDPDDVLRLLGLAWSMPSEPVLRIEVPLAAVRATGAFFAIPTLLDVLDDSPPALSPDWRARPEHEHRSNEPWGHARDMLHDGAGLPEIIVDIRPAGIMDAECIGVPRIDWSARPYLHRSAPR
ncbi:hypothetical protein [Polyangium aurulentum]|uniref:hypothetical protein n=1 Tax=Polyangium aurulentum TaxID=2567896 RepID=UPI0010AECA5D|nr:hypothetical protein [Polyangium aurulentum]UQA62139.1 hypothetical protein E8A73_017375 [Polyangium aurulentum]